MHDLVIRGGTLMDGTGAPGAVGDLAIDEGRISAVGGDVGPGVREIDATGKHVCSTLPFSSYVLFIIQAINCAPRLPPSASVPH